MAITDLTGTKWAFRDLAGTSATQEFALNFISNATNYNAIITETGFRVDKISYKRSSSTIQVYNGISQGWISQPYRIIEITGGADATNTDLISWLTNYATQIPVINLIGTKWALNNDLSLSWTDFNYNLLFTNNNNNYLSFNNVAENQTHCLLYDNLKVFEKNWSDPGSWINVVYRMISITGGTDVSNPDLLAWLAQNATQVSAINLTGTKWVLNSNLEYPGQKYYYINLRSNHQNFSTFSFVDGWNDIFLRYETKNAYRFNIESDAWIDENYRSIEIIDGADVSNPDLLIWLTQNAMQMSIVDLTGTKWTIHNKPNIDFQQEFNLNFTSNETNYERFRIDNDDYYYGIFYYLSSLECVYYASSQTWTSEIYRIISITGGADVSNPKLLIWLAQNAEQEPESKPTGIKNILSGTLKIDKIAFGSLDVNKIYMGQTLVWQAGPIVDPILNNNSWAVIAQVCNAGQAADYWALGDTKTDLGTDGVTRTFRICDMQELYGKNAVFEQVELEDNSVAWNTNTNVDDDDCYNNYSISKMRNTHLPALLANYSLDLQAVITNTTYKVAKNGTQTTVLDLIDKLFLPAEREIFDSQSYSRQEEWNTLARFALYALPENDNGTFRKKYRPSASTSAYTYWERSPRSGNTSNVCGVSSSGYNYNEGADGSCRIAPCFALGSAPSVTSYEIGFRGMSNSNPTLTRTGEAIGATWAATSGVISIDGIDLTKIFGGYVGNDGEKLTWDSATSKYLHNDTPYTGNVFVKINRFFAKAHYENNVLDGYDLCFAPTAPDNTYQDWFLGKDHCIIGCYKARGGGFSNGLQSKQGLIYTSPTSANAIVAAYKRNSSTAYSLHEKWYNENAILQVLFMAIFATRKTEDVFPQDTFRHRSNDTRPTGYMDAYRAQSLFAYEPTGDSGKRGNMFLGIEDFVGWGQELVAGVVLSNENIHASLDYANFVYSGSYADSGLDRPTNSDYIKELQQSDMIAGLLVPKVASGASETTYFCDYNYYSSGTMVWYQGAYGPDAFSGVFYFRGDRSADYSSGYCAARLCGTPK